MGQGYAREPKNNINRAAPHCAFHIVRIFCHTYSSGKTHHYRPQRDEKISANPSIFGGNAGKTWFYDDQFLYEIKNNATRKIALANIIKIGPGNTEINSRRVWIVIYRDGANEKQVQFYNNLTLWNHNFTAFLAAVKEPIMTLS